MTATSMTEMTAATRMRLSAVSEEEELGRGVEVENQKLVLENGALLAVNIVGNKNARGVGRKREAL